MNPKYGSRKFFISLLGIFIIIPVMFQVHYLKMDLELFRFFIKGLVGIIGIYCGVNLFDYGVEKVGDVLKSKSGEVSPGEIKKDGMQ